MTGQEEVLWKGKAKSLKEMQCIRINARDFIL
jgi:hypothetical protein